MNDQAKYTVTLEFQTAGADKELNNLREFQRGLDGAARAGGLSDKSLNSLSQTTNRLESSLGGANGLV